MMEAINPPPPPPTPPDSLPFKFYFARCNFAALRSLLAFFTSFHIFQDFLPLPSIYHIEAATSCRGAVVTHLKLKFPRLRFRAFLEFPSSNIASSGTGN